MRSPINSIARSLLVVGPGTGPKERAYGANTGGYIRNMEVYLLTLSTDRFKLFPFYHTVRGRDGRFLGNPVVRMIRDTVSFAVTCLRKRPSAVHILAQYRGALAREYAHAMICHFLGIPFGYDIKAGAFKRTYHEGGSFYRAMQRQIVSWARIIFVEGRSDQKFVQNTFKKNAVYFPNFVPKDDVPTLVPFRDFSNPMKIIFVGRCCLGKGVPELVNGACEAAHSGLVQELVLAGPESPEFTAWLDEIDLPKGLTIRRCGRLPHSRVIEELKRSEVFAYPSEHPGEGHSNAINEAMMCGLAIMSTRHGFLGDVLDGQCAHFISKRSATSIRDALIAIHSNPDESSAMALRARQKLMSEFTSDKARTTFHSAYSELFLP